ncbi:DNA-binding Lrp family transcriptional regulator [Neisseria sp. HSC-16F19]|nr:Lrp/AsnC family transcriptional regulator [Neisseria sp. HSC-16F19]MCP2041229.1 DNA-binding Lrp family transcriptional regulator [Neisseria sp. HSC-16F19]
MDYIPDSFDRQILAILQKDADTPKNIIAERVNLSASAVTRRIAQLRQCGIIERTVCVLNPKKLGCGITILTEVVLENERVDLFDEAMRRFEACPQVQQMYYVTGKFEFLLIFAVRDMEEYERLARKLFFELGNVLRFDTYVSMKNVKQSLEVVIDEPGH